MSSKRLTLFVALVLISLPALFLIASGAPANANIEGSDASAYFGHSTNNGNKNANSGGGGGGKSSSSQNPSLDNGASINCDSVLYAIMTNSNCKDSTDFGIGTACGSFVEDLLAKNPDCKVQVQRTLDSLSNLDSASGNNNPTGGNYYNSYFLSLLKLLRMLMG